MRICTIAFITGLEMVRRKDFYVLLILLGALLCMLVSFDVFGLGGVTGYIKDAGLLATWLFGWILTVNVSARQLPQEERRGTIYPLLAKPVTRAQVVVGKWLGGWGSAAAAILAFYVVLVLVVAQQGGAFAWPAVLQAYVLHVAAMGVVAALALLLSARMNADAAAALTYVLTAASFIVVPRVPVFAANQQVGAGTGLRIIYYLLPHFELFDMRRRLVHDYGAARWAVVGVVLAYGAVLIALFLLLAWLAYRRRRFSRSALD